MSCLPRDWRTLLLVSVYQYSRWRVCRFVQARRKGRYVVVRMHPGKGGRGRTYAMPAVVFRALITGPRDGGGLFLSERSLMANRSLPSCRRWPKNVLAYVSPRFFRPSCISVNLYNSVAFLSLSQDSQTSPSIAPFNFPQFSLLQFPLFLLQTGVRV